jgi:hypothetical protein
VGVLLDDREQVGQQATLDDVQLGALHRGSRIGGIDLIDRRARRRDQRRPRALSVAAGARGDLRGGCDVRDGGDIGGSGGAAGRSCGMLLRAVQPLGRGFALLRNRRPSSYRLA